MDDENRIERYEGGARSPARHPHTQLVPYEILEVEEGPGLLVYWRVIRKRQWTILTIALVLFTVVSIGTLKQKPVYRARALLEIQKENPEILSFQDLLQLESVSDNYLETQYRILKSDSLARRVIEQLRLDKLEEFNSRKSWWSATESKLPPREQVFAVENTGLEADPDAYHKTLKRFQEQLSIEPIRRSRLVAINFESYDPMLAARVVNTLASNYIDQSLEARWEATQKAAEWLSTQLLGLKAKLEKSEEDLQKYAREQGLLFLESEQGNAENIVNQRLRQLQDELTKAQALRYEKESVYRLIEAGDYGSLPGIFDSKLMQDLTVRLAELSREHAELLTTFTEDYPKVKQVQNQIDQIESVLTRERARAAKRITNDYQAAASRETLLRRAFEEQQKQANVVAERSVQYNILKREVETNKQLYEGLLQRLKEAGVSAGLKASNIRIVDSGETPKKPAKPGILLNLSLAVIFGLALGVGAAFFQEYLDNTLKTPEDVERSLHVPALALIPSADSLNGRRSTVYGLYERGRLLGKDSGEHKALGQETPHWFRIDQIDQTQSALSEAFRSLRTSVLLSSADRPPRSLLVTSARPGEGKTTVSSNLAISLTQLGQRVLLIDGDMRRPSIHKTFQTTRETGLVSYLIGQQAWRAVVQATQIEGLDVLVCGPMPPNPAELLSSERMRVLIQQAVSEYHFVLVDSPPLINVADSRILATLVDGLLLVVEGGSTPRELVQRAQQQAREVGAHVVGVVLNNLDLKSHDYYYYSSYRYDSWESPGGKTDKG